MRLVDVLVSVLGVAVIVGLVWAAAGSAVARVGDAAAVQARLHRELPGFALGRLILDARGRSAAALSADGRVLAVLFVLGRRLVCWALPAEGRAPATLVPLPEGYLALRIATGEFTRPHVDLWLSDPAQAEGFLA